MRDKRTRWHILPELNGTRKMAPTSLQNNKKRVYSYTPPYKGRSKLQQNYLYTCYPLHVNVRTLGHFKHFKEQVGTSRGPRAGQEEHFLEGTTWK